ncbi:MAG TPA: AAA family ATPase [Actinomycetota bacterium]|nr:AAA family ATPase [Actinomycetota bacterium]
MKIDHVKVQGYRSLYDITLVPQPLTVLVGPNNGGKSNLIEAIDFLAEVYRLGLEVAVSRKGGIENIAFRRMRRTKRPLSFELKATFDAQGIVPGPGNRSPGRASVVEVSAVHRFALATRSQRAREDYVVTQESLHMAARAQGASKSSSIRWQRFPDDPAPFSLEDETELGPLLWRMPFENRDLLTAVVESTRPTELAVSIFERMNPIIGQFAETTGSTREFQLEPLECRAAGVPTPNAELDRHGRNLPAVVDYMRKNDPRAWAQVLDAMRRIVPGLDDVRTEFTPDRRLALQFFERGVGRHWSSEDVSDGTIRSLALFVAILDPRTPVVLVEEPENATHPWILRTFVEACRSAQKQVFLTTHSPVMVENVKPEELVVVWRQDGRTRVEQLPSLDADIPTMWGEGKVTLFELLDSGLVPQAVPGVAD